MKVWVLALIVVCVFACRVPSAEARLRAGVAAVPITPFGPNPDWKGPISKSGVWGDEHNPIWMAGFGNNRPAEGKHDDLWARALVLESDDTRVAFVALDLIGYYQNAGYYGVDFALKQVNPQLHFDAVIVASTHNHEGPDTIGLWGKEPGQDGKYRAYLEFVDRQIAKALNEAGDPKRMVEVHARFASTRVPELRNLQVRTGHRPPNFFDEEMRVMQLVGTGGRFKNKTVATLVNWNTHPESMEGGNRILTSDFPHYVRDAIEKNLGGTALYFSGAIGAAEIIGDAPVAGDFETIGPKKFPLDPKTHRPPISFERTQAIGEIVAAEAANALDRAEESPITYIKIRTQKITVPVTNPLYLQLQKAGVLARADSMGTTLYYISMGAAEFITLPGEVFPELLYGVEKFHREDCPQANTHRPYEPAILPMLKTSYKFVIGLAPDEYGYAVPQYDFNPLPPQPWLPDGRQQPDACAASGVPSHYHETNSISYEFAPFITCGFVQMMSGDVGSYKACDSYMAAMHLK